MCFIKWRPELYHLDIETLDNEHRELVQIANKIHKCMNDDDDPGDILPVLQQLKEHTIRHFESEEQLMRKIDYDQTDYHLQIHKDLLEKFERYFQDCKAGEKTKFTGLMNFIKGWVLNHILVEDDRMARAVKKELRKKQEIPQI